MHPNGVRAQLIRMRKAGLLERRKVPTPRDEWAISATARPGGEPPEAHRLVARWSARSIPATPGGGATRRSSAHLHRGLTRGILDQLAPQATLTRLLSRDLDTAGCEVAVAGLPATAP